ncbi:hypothetical protein JQM84_07955 [Parabacteroides distasonis]|nr:hypothetical protein [Parabacteroides distasonis]
MNKKLFTLAAGLLLGTAFTVNAADVTTSQVTSTAPLKSSSYYYLQVGTKFMGANNAVTDYTSLETADAVNETKRNYYLWNISVTSRNGKDYVVLTNKGTGKVLGFKEASGTISLPTNKNEVVVTELLWKAIENGDSGKAYDGKTDVPTGGNKVSNEYKGSEGGELKIEGKELTKDLTFTDSGDKVKVYQEAEISMHSGKLNELLGDGFTFNFPTADPQPEENIFARKIVAVELPKDAKNITLVENGDPVAVLNDANQKLNTTEDAVYFVVEAEDGAILKDYTTGKYYFANRKAYFEDAKFIAVEPIANYNINGFVGAQGAKFQVISGADLKTAAAKAVTHVDNAKFTVKEVDPLNNKGAYQIKVTPYTAADSKTDVAKQTAAYVSAFTTMGATYVTLCADGQNNAIQLAQLKGGNLVVAKDFLKKDGPSVFNIQFTSGEEDAKKVDTYSEYGKYLGLYSKNGGAYSYLAQGPDFVDLTVPQNQWIVTGVENDVITFTNRENDGKSIALELRKTSKENVYDVRSLTSTTFDYAYVDKDGKYQVAPTPLDFQNGKMQVKLTPATIVPTAGYVDLTEEDLANPVQMNFSVGTALVSKEIFMTANVDAAPAKSVGLTEDEDDAAWWDIVKFKASADSIHGKTKYVYLKDEKVTEIEEAIEDKSLTTYAFKLHGEDAYLSANIGGTSFELEKTKKQSEASRFLIKENKDGSLYLIDVTAILAASNSYSDFIKNNTKAISLTTAGAPAYGNVYIYEHAGEKSVALNLESVVEVSTSLEAEPRHASFQSVNGGFLGMDENNNAIIAATQDETKALTFWLDTTDVKELTNNFYISQAVASEPEVETKAANAKPRMFLFNPADSVAYYDEGTASTTTDYNYLLSNKATTKAMFKAATLINKDSINTIIKDKEVGLNKDNGLNRFKFQIVEANEDGDEYAIKSGDKYLVSINGKIGFGAAADALIVSLGEGDATANEAIEAETGVQVIGGQGAVTVQGAAGKVITVANILGQTIANQVAASDNVTIAAPAGIVVVAVEGEATKVVVK